MFPLKLELELQSLIKKFPNFSQDINKRKIG